MIGIVKNKGLPWFRAYATDVDDANLRLLAFEDRWHLHAIRCLKCAGMLDAGDSQALLRQKIAVKLGLQLRELEAVETRLAELNLITPGTFQPVDWNERQFLSDTSTGRVRAFRERQKRPGNGDETFQKQHKEQKAKRERNVSEAAPDTETDTDKKTTTAAPGSLLWDSLPGLSAEERVVVVGMLKDLDPAEHQDVLDELAGAFRAKTIKRQWREWLRGVIQNGFQPSLALSIQSERKRRVEEEQLAKKRRAEAAERNARFSTPEAKSATEAHYAKIEQVLHGRAG